MTSNPQLCFRHATRADLAAVQLFLAANERTVGGVEDQLERFWLAVHEEQIIGSAGLESYGSVGLLRSVAVLPEKRNQGIGKELVRRIIQDAKNASVVDLYLLTTNADRYFAGFGFRTLDRAEAPKALLASAEFHGACPESATLMQLSLVLPGSDLQNPAAAP